MNNFVKVFTGFFLVVGLSGCGGGGGDSKNSQSVSVPDTPPPIKVMNCAEKTYVQANFDQEIIDPSCSGENKVSVFLRRYVDAGVERLEMDIWTNVATPIYTQSFLLAYDPNVLRYVSHKPGNFFGTDSVTAEAVMRSDEGAAGGTFWGCKQMPGKSAVMVSVSRQGAYTAELSGNNLALRLEFEIVGSGETDLAFADAKLEKRTYEASNPLTELGSCWPKSLKIKI